MTQRSGQNHELSKCYPLRSNRLPLKSAKYQHHRTWPQPFSPPGRLMQTATLLLAPTFSHSQSLTACFIQAGFATDLQLSAVCKKTCTLFLSNLAYVRSMYSLRVSYFSFAKTDCCRILMFCQGRRRAELCAARLYHTHYPTLTISGKGSGVSGAVECGADV